MSERDKIPAFTRNGKQILLGTTHFADGRDDDAAEQIMNALNTSPLIQFGQAEAIGRELCDRWSKMSKGPPPLDLDDMAWADIVQFVLRRASEIQRYRREQ